MSLRGRSGEGGLQVDEAVKRALAAYGQAPLPARAATVRRLAERLTVAQRRQLIARLAEISLGQLWALQGEPDD